MTSPHPLRGRGRAGHDQAAVPAAAVEPARPHEPAGADAPVTLAGAITAIAFDGLSRR